MKKYEIKTIFSAVDKMSKVVGNMESHLGRFVGKTSMAMRKLDKFTTGAVMTIGRGLKTGFLYAAGAATTLGYGIMKVMSAFSEVEDAEAAFTPLLGGAEQAKDMVARLNKEADTTPFEFEQLAGVTKQLLPVMNGDIQKTIDTMRMLGDASGGNANKMESATRGYTKAMLKGKVDMESLNMIGEAGIPIFDQLAKSMGVKTGKRFFQMISSGKVKTKDLTAAFQKMTSEGGLFYKGMDLASATFSGRMSTLKDSVKRVARELGGALAPTIKDLVDKAVAFMPVIQKWLAGNRKLIQSKFAEYVKKIGDAIKWLIKHFDEIVKWGKRLVIVVVGIKAVASAMGMINLAMLALKWIPQQWGMWNTEIKNVGKNMPAATKGIEGAASATKNWAGAAMSVAASFAAAYEAGKWLYENVLEPQNKEAIKKQRQAEEALQSEGKMGQLLTEGTAAERFDIIAKQRKGIVAAGQSFTSAENVAGNILSAFTGEESPIEKKMKIMAQLASQREELYGSLGQEHVATVENVLALPVGQSSETNTTTTQNQQLEITIKDETGRARITKKSRGANVPKLVPTGAM
jgi:tape measure domain-containing protein